MFDVAVIGGGPAGSAAASTLARLGHRVILFERERFPRFHIGESQLPWINEILQKIGAEDVVAREGFVQKWGASFTTSTGDADQYADFAQAFEVPRPQTIQVPRERFDQFCWTRCRVWRSCAAGADHEGRGVRCGRSHGHAQRCGWRA